MVMLDEKNMLDEKGLLLKLNELIELEVEELQKYSTTVHCNRAKRGMEKQYKFHAEQARLLKKMKKDIFFADVFGDI